MVVDDLGDDEVEELLGERGVEVALLGERAQTLDLLLLALRVGGGRPWAAFSAPTCCVNLKRSASMCTTAASMLSMLSRMLWSCASVSASSF